MKVIRAQVHLYDEEFTIRFIYVLRLIINLLKTPCLHDLALSSINTRVPITGINDIIALFPIEARSTLTEIIPKTILNIQLSDTGNVLKNLRS